MDDYRSPAPAHVARRDGAVHGRRRRRCGNSTTRCSSMCCRSRRVRSDCRPSTIWRPKPRDDMPGSIWLPDTGYGALAPVMEDYFERGLQQATGGDRDRAAGVLLSGKLLDVVERGEACAGARLSRTSPGIPDGTDGWAAHRPAAGSCARRCRGRRQRNEAVFIAAPAGSSRASANSRCSILPGTSQA